MTSLSLVPDCGSCFALCCTALAFTRSADFAIDKDVGVACPNLACSQGAAGDFGCTIHAELRPRGFKGCTVFDCFGAGQHVAQGTYAGRSWQQAPESAAEMFAVFTVMRQLHEYLWYLDDAERMTGDTDLVMEVRRLREITVALTEQPGDDLVRLDAEHYRAEVNGLLTRASESARRGLTPVRSHPALRRRPDLIGAQLERADLRGADLRGTYLIAADLTGADLRCADLLGADLRDAVVAGADLSRSLFLTQPQVQSARGNARTRLPAFLERPDHWGR